LPDYGETGGAAGRRAGGKRPGAHRGSDGGWNSGQGGAGDGARRTPAMGAAGSRGPTRGLHVRGNMRACKLQGGLEQRLGACVGSESRRRYKLDDGDPAAATGVRTPASWGFGLSNK
jgi:hypothetical protein